MSDSVDIKQLRTFGLVVGGAFGIIGVWPVLVHGEALRLWALTLTGLLVISALFVPRGLKLVHRAWMACGHILGQVNTTIILTIVFYSLFTPMGLVMRLFGKDPMHRKLEPNSDTYRVIRQGRSPSHMNRQF
jgi:hypothetical protein